jgi:hypothetical protein
MPEQSSSAADMIRRFRQSRPTSRAEREQERKKNPEAKEMWWVQGKQISSDREPKARSNRDDLDVSEPRPSARPIPSKPSNRADLLHNLDKKKMGSPTRSSVSSIPVRVRSSLAPRRDSSDASPQRQGRDRAVDKLRDSMEVDDWIENEIKSLEAELGRNKSGQPSRSTSRDKDRATSYRYALDEDPSSAFHANATDQRKKNPFLEQSRLSLDNSGKWLRGSSDTLGSIKGLLDMDLRFDSKAKPKVKDQAAVGGMKKDEYLPLMLDNIDHSDLHDVNHDLETLLATLKKEQAGLPNPADLDHHHAFPSADEMAAAAGVDLTISQVSNQLSANMIAFTAAFGVRDEMQQINDEERKRFEENIREQGRREEREKRLLSSTSAWDDYSHTNHQHQYEGVMDEVEETKPRAVDLKAFPPSSRPPSKDGPLRSPVLPAYTKPTAKIAASPMMSEPMIRDTMFIQSALDTEFIAMSQAMKQMQSYRHRLNYRLRSLQQDNLLDADEDNQQLSGMMPRHAWEPQYDDSDWHRSAAKIQAHSRFGYEQPWNNRHHPTTAAIQHQSITAAASDIHDTLESAIADLQEKFPSSGTSSQISAATLAPPSFPTIDSLAKAAPNDDFRQHPSEEAKATSSKAIVTNKEVEEKLVHDAALKLVADSTAAAAAALKQAESLMSLEYSDDEEQEVKLIQTKSSPATAVAAASDRPALKIASFAAASKDSAATKPLNEAGVGKIVSSTNIAASSTITGNWEPMSLPLSSNKRNPIISELNKFDQILGAERDESGANPFEISAGSRPSSTSAMRSHDVRDKVVGYQPSQRAVYEATIRKEFEEATGRHRTPPRPSAPPIPSPSVNPYPHTDRWRYPDGMHESATYTNSAPRISDRDAYQYHASSSSYKINQPTEGLALNHIRMNQMRAPVASCSIPSSSMMSVASHHASCNGMATPSIDAPYQDRERYLRQMQQLRTRILP